MTKLLQEALAAVQCLPEEDQDAIASLILEELVSEKAWGEAFANSQEELSLLAAKAREDQRAGRTDFKVLEWLREVRDKNAKEEEGLSDQECLRRTKEGAKEILDAMRTDPRNTFHEAGDWRKGRGGGFALMTKLLQEPWEAIQSLSEKD